MLRSPQGLRLTPGVFDHHWFSKSKQVCLYPPFYGNERWFGWIFIVEHNRSNIPSAPLHPVERMAMSRSQISNFPSGNYDQRQKLIFQEIHTFFSYDDISIMFDNLGYGYNAVINGLSIFILKTQVSWKRKAENSCSLLQTCHHIANLLTFLPLRKKTLREWCAVR